MFGSRKSKSPVVPEEEWNFADVLEFDAETCLRYEFAREIPNPGSYFTSFESSKIAPFVLEPWTLSPNQDRAASIDFKEHRSTLLIRPLAAVDQDQKFESRELFPGLYFLHRDGSCRTYPADLLVTPWIALEEGLKANLQEYTERFLGGFSLFPTSELQHRGTERLDKSETASQTGTRQVFAAKIDWRKNDSLLIAAFTSWLHKERPKNISSVAPTSGRHSVYDSLNALSALRLRNRLSIEDAMAYTKTILRRPLYRDRSSWDRAQRRALQLFKYEFPGAGSPKSASTISNRKT